MTTKTNQQQLEEAVRQLQRMPQPEIDQKVMGSTPFRWDDVDAERKIASLWTKVGKTLADLVTLLAAEDGVPKGTEVRNLLAEGIVRRFERVGTSSPDAQFHYITSRQKQRMRVREELRHTWDTLHEWPPDEAKELEKVCIMRANKWKWSWPPSTSDRPMDRHIWEVAEELATGKKASGEDGGWLRLREIYRKIGIGAEAAELAMARHPTAKREDGCRGTVWYWLPSSDDEESPPQAPDMESTDNSHQEARGEEIAAQS